MKLSFYDTRVTEGGRTALVEERAVDCPMIDRIVSPDSAVHMLNSTVSLNQMGEEHCYMIGLNVAGKPLGIFFIAKGAACQCPVGVREVFMRALMVGAIQILFYHNHPTGDCTPSKLDVELTDRLKKAGELLNIPLVDHIIIGGNGYFSFKEHSML